MSGFRGSDETLEQEISTLEAIARLRIRRYGRELKELERDLRELKTERVRRRAKAYVPGVPEGLKSTADSATSG